jgi:hypothetical protein
MRCFSEVDEAILEAECVCVLGGCFVKVLSRQ